MGIVTECHEGGVVASVLGGVFEHVSIPAHWMLNPSRYDPSTGSWVWTPAYDDDDDADVADGKEEEVAMVGNDGGRGVGEVDRKEFRRNGKNRSVVKQEEEEEEDVSDEPPSSSSSPPPPEEVGGSRAVEEEITGDIEANRFEIVIGSEIRFKVKAVNFTRITTTMKGVQATTTTSSSHVPSSSSSLHASSSSSPTETKEILNGSGGGGGGSGSTMTFGGGLDNGHGFAATNIVERDIGSGGGTAVRTRSSSVDLSDDTRKHPAPMQIVGSICEDGLGLISWWKSSGEEEEEEEGGENAFIDDECDVDGGNGIMMDDDIGGGLTD